MPVMAGAFLLRLKIRAELGLHCGYHQEHPCLGLPTHLLALVVGLPNFDVSHQAAPCA